MEKSDHYYRRRELLESSEFPSISEYKTQLGDHLCDAFFTHCADALKPYIGLTPKLRGAGDDLWISPSDLLIGKVCLKPPLTSKYVKALTHQGIFSIGCEIETKVNNEINLKIKKAVAENEEIVCFLAEIEKQKSVELAHQTEQNACKEEKMILEARFAEKLQYELSQLTELLKNEYEAQLSKQKKDIEQEWAFKLVEAVSDTVKRLNEHLLSSLENEEKLLLRDFSIEKRKNRIRQKMSKQLADNHSMETFFQLKHQMECKNIANIMYVLCMERHKCQAQQQNIIEDYEKKIKLLQSDIHLKDNMIASISKDRDDRIRHNKLREECLLEILRQYQKFINFALRAAPTQAEFLLNIEKMLIYELTQAVAKTDKKHAKCLAETLFAWKSESEITSSTSDLSKESRTYPTFHNCYNELEPPTKSTDTIPEKEYLPAFYYNNKMYVREDFRNMMSQGVRISPSNLIWNRDVEHLMKILRSSVCVDTQETNLMEHQEPERLEDHVQCIETHEALTDNEFNMLRPIISTESSLASLVHYNDVAIQTTPSDIKLQEPCCQHTSIESCTAPVTQAHSSDTEIVKKLHVPIIETTNSLDALTESLKEKKKSGSGASVRIEPVVLQLSSKLSVHKEFDKKKTLSSDINTGTGILHAVDSLDKLRKSLAPSSHSKLTKHQIYELPVSKGSYGSNDECETETVGILGTKDSLYLQKMSMLQVDQQETDQKAKDNHITLTDKRRLSSTSNGMHKSILKQPSFSNMSYDKPCEELAKTAGSNLKCKESLLEKESSRLANCRDSLEIIRTCSRISKVGVEDPTTEQTSQISVEIRNEILQANSPILLEDSKSKSVRLSHVEIIPKKIYGNEFKHHRKHDYKAKIPIKMDSPWLIYGDKEPISKESEQSPMQPVKPVKKVSAAKIIGDRKAKEHLAKHEDFALCRINSMMSIFRKHPSLIRIFTSCTK